MVPWALYAREVSERALQASSLQEELDASRRSGSDEVAALQAELEKARSQASARASELESSLSRSEREAVVRDKLLSSVRADLDASQQAVEEQGAARKALAAELEKTRVAAGDLLKSELEKARESASEQVSAVEGELAAVKKELSDAE